MTTYFLMLDGDVMFAVTVRGDRATREERALDYFGSCMQDEPSGAAVEAMVKDGTYTLASVDGPIEVLHG